ncbi:outer membrane beta-barrel protein [Vibrio rotiferianus]|uniref:outer membrane beta-barrel protein n=1 Tax=Vibrio rotiferianus TaxID=190895 RepID=UPI00406A63AF
MYKLSLSFIFSLTMSCGFAFANQDKNIVGAEFGYGSLSNELLAGDRKGNIVDNDIGSLSIFYRRMITSNLGLEAGYRSSFGGFGSMLTSGIAEAKDPAFYGPRAAIYGELPLNKYFGLHGKLGINYSTLEYTSKQLNKSLSISNVGGEGTVGFYFDMSRFRLGIDYTYLSSKYFDSSIYSVTTMFKF